MTERLTTRGGRSQAAGGATSPLVGIRERKSSTQVIDGPEFVSLEALSRRAANDALRRFGQHLPDDQFDALACHLLDKRGVPAFRRYDPERSLSHGDAFNYAYRQMRGWRAGSFTDGPTKDWMRTNLHDRRFEPEVYASVTETGDLPERHKLDAQAIQDVAEHYAGGLPEREAWTLRHVASAVAEGLTLVEVCDRLLADLADALRPQIPAVPGGTSMEFFETWFWEAA